MPRGDLTNQVFGRLKVVSVAGSNGNCVLYNCICECSNHHIVKSYLLKQGKVKSCGCLHKDSMSHLRVRLEIGSRFGRLTVLADTGRKLERTTLWLCRCDCGTEIEVPTSSLKKGNTRSCGCLKRDTARVRSTTHGLSKTPAYQLHMARAYQARRAQRLPTWADTEAIKQFYLNCPDGHHVDHIIPLYGEQVSGLHVLENLQYLPAFDNYSKRNRFIPRIEIKGETPKWFDEMNLH